MDASNPISNLAKALSVAQGMIKAPLKNRHVDFTPKSGGRVKYAYADLADVIEAVREPLSKNELAIVHRLVYDGASKFGLLTSLIHSSGEKLETWYPLPDPSDRDIKPQEFGSALTYGRRYSLSSLIGIASEEDDDGQTAAPASKQSPAATKSEPIKNHAPTTTGPSQPQLKRLYAIAAENSWPSESVRMFCVRKVGRTPGQLSQESYNKFCAFLNGAPYDEKQIAEIEKIKKSLTATEVTLLEKNKSDAPIDDKPFEDYVDTHPNYEDETR
jgi:hypothetical protein